MLARAQIQRDGNIRSADPLQHSQIRLAVGFSCTGCRPIWLGKSDGRINVLIVFRDINPFTGLDRGVGFGREGHGGGTRGGLDLSPEDAEFGSNPNSAARSRKPTALLDTTATPSSATCCG